MSHTLIIAWSYGDVTCFDIVDDPDQGVFNVELTC